MTEKELQRLKQSHHHNSDGGGQGLRILSIVLGCLALFTVAYLGFNRVVKYTADQSQRKEQARQEAQQKSISDHPVQHKPIVVGGPRKSTVTLTNREGLVFENISIVRTNLDSLVYTATNGLGGGTLKFADLPEYLQKKYGYTPELVAETEAQSSIYRPPPAPEVQTTEDRGPGVAQENISGVEIMVDEGDPSRYNWGPRVVGMTLRLTTGDRIELKLFPNRAESEANYTIGYANSARTATLFQEFLVESGAKAYRALQQLDNNPTYLALRKRGIEQQKTIEDTRQKIMLPPPQYSRNATVATNYKNTMRNFLNTTSSNYTVTVNQLKFVASGHVVAQSGLRKFVRQ
jgi:hypothetical protein